MPTPNVTVIGAGPAGLTAAYELSKLGISSTVLEADNQVGGISRTVDYRGFRFDVGGHRFFTKVPYVQQLWEEILEEDFLLRPRLSRIYYRGCFYDYPLRAANALANLGLVEALLIGMSYTKARLRPMKGPQSFEQWVTNRFGYRLYSIFFKTYTEKVWGMPCSQISGDWAAQRIRSLSLREAIRSSLFGDGRSRDGSVVTSLIREFYYPRLGPGMMWERCAELLAASGNETICNTKVQRICHRQGRVERVYVRKKRSKELDQFGGDAFISTMPLRELVQKLDPRPPAEILQAARRLRYRDYLTVVLIVKREDVFPDNWIYIHSPEVKMGRIQNYRNWSPDMVPDPSRTSLGLEYFLWDKDDEWSWTTDQLMDLGIRECAQIGLIEPSEVEDGTVVRMRKTYPVYDQMYHDSVSKIRDYLESFPNLQTIGRNGLHRYNNQDHSMLTGVYAARNVAGAEHDVWSVNADSEYQEEGRAEVQRRSYGPPAKPAVPGEAARVESPEEAIERIFAQLDPLALGCSVGLVSGVGLLLATAALLLKGGPVVGPTLSLLGQYLPGFTVSWPGAFLGFLEAGAAGFALGQMIARMRNWGTNAYAWLIRRQHEAESRRNLLDKV